jgi:hypothetical protein
MLAPCRRAQDGYRYVSCRPRPTTTRQHRGASHAPRHTVSVMYPPGPNVSHHSKPLEKFIVALQCRQGKKPVGLTSQLWHNLCFYLWATAVPLRRLPGSG